MRISDWSSDVCSSDLFGLATLSQGGAQAAASSIPVTVVQPNVGQQDKWVGSKADANFAKLARLTTPKEDRKSVVLGQSVSVRVDLGGRRIIKKQKTINVSANKHS